MAGESDRRARNASADDPPQFLAAAAVYLDRIAGLATLNEFAPAIPGSTPYRNGHLRDEQHRRRVGVIQLFIEARPEPYCQHLLLRGSQRLHG